MFDEKKHFFFNDSLELFALWVLFQLKVTEWERDRATSETHENQFVFENLFLDPPA